MPPNGAIWRDGEDPVAFLDTHVWPDSAEGTIGIRPMLFHMGQNAAQMDRSRGHYAFADETFAKSQVPEITFEELESDYPATLARIAERPGAAPFDLPNRFNRLNSRPKSEVISNWDAVRSAFDRTDYAWMFA